MLNVLIALIVTLAVGYMIVKKYKPQPVLIIGAFILLICAILLTGKGIVPAKQSSGLWWIDLFALIRITLSSRVAKLGITIMTVGGFVNYMNTIGASKSLVHVAIKPLKKLNAPYVVLAGSYIIGEFLGLFINSASGLGMLLMVTMFPILARLGISRLSAAAVVGTALCIDWSPANVGPTLAAELSHMDLMTYWYTYELPVCLVGIAVVAVLHFVVQQYFDKKDKAEIITDLDTDKEVDVENIPRFYFLLPTIPLVLLLVFSKLLIKSVKIDIIDAMLMTLALAMLCELIRTKDLQGVLKSSQVFFDGMGSQFAKVVTLVVSGEMFANGLKAIGAVNIIINAAHNAGFSSVPMLLVMVIIIGVSTVVMGSGNAAFLTFANLVPEISGKLGVIAPLFLVPMEMTSSIMRSVSPITAVIVVVSSIAKISPVDLVKRTAIPMLGAFIANFIAAIMIIH